MYSVYCDDTLIYNDSSGEKEVRLVAPTVEWSDNSTGSFTFTLPECNVGYSILTLMQSTIKIFRDNTLIWVGRAIKETKDFWKNRQITCEGALGYLNDVIQPQMELPGDEHPNFQGYCEEYLGILLDYHNSVMNQNGTPERRIFKGRVTINKKMKSDEPDAEYFGPDDDPGYIPTIYVDNKNTLECITEKLTGGKDASGDDLEGHLRLRIEPDGFYLDYLQDPISESTQTIEFGKNLLDYTENFDESDFCTVMHPRGESDGNSVGNLSAHKELLPSQNGIYYKEDLEFEVKAPRVIFKGDRNTHGGGVNTFGWIERILDLSDLGDEDTLLDKTLEWFTKNRFNDIEINIKAFDLAYLGSTADYFQYMDSIHVISLPHGLDREFPVLGVSIPLDQPQNASYTLGKKKVQSLSAHTSQAEKESKAYTEEKAYEAYHDSETLIRNSTNGVVNIIKNQYGAEGMAIVGVDQSKTYYKDGKSYTANQVIEMIKNGDIDFTIERLPQCWNPSTGRYEDIPIWYWNMGGLAFFPNGWNSGTNVAITRDGKINADYIKSGKIVAIDIDGTTITGGEYHTVPKYVYYNGVQRGPYEVDIYYNDVYFRNKYGYADSSWGSLSMLPTQNNQDKLSLSSGCNLELYASENAEIYATSIALQSAGGGITINGMDVQNLATKSWVEEYVDEHGGGDYVTHSELDDTLRGYVTDSELSNTVNNIKHWCESTFKKK